MQTAGKVWWALLSAAAMAWLMPACGGSDTSPSNNGGGPPVSTTTITIANNAVSPANIVVAQGSQVTFVNNDSRSHEMFSDPHPEHTDCPEINAVGFLSAGQRRQTENLNTIRTCGFHDHNDPARKTLQGTIVIQ